ncbi:MAG: hypothetical protein HZA95_02025 [Candidatus Vogelbacteria bacterium]|nr:hypothetical protein [Candidatus Vogelbacteria bacterium]
MKKGSKRILHSEETKATARKLRSEGFTHREIKKKLGIALSTIFDWTGHTVLTSEQRKAVLQRNYSKTFPERRIEQLSKQARKNLSRYWKIPYNKDELISKIRIFYNKNGRIPMKREFDMYREYKKRFCSWNMAIEAAGLIPHKVIFSTRVMAKDGHICDSFAETLIDDWLHYNKVSTLEIFRTVSID